MGSITLRQAIRRILEEDDLRAAAGKLFDMATIDPDEEKEETTGNNGPLRKTQTTVKGARAAIKAGLYKVGDVVLKKNGFQWRLVDIRNDNYTLMTTHAFTYAPFARPDKQHPWGWNNWVASQIREELNNLWLKRMFKEEEKDIPFNFEVEGKIFLLSEEEAGFKQTERTFEYFRKTDKVDEDELSRRRSMADYEQDECFWWLRSPCHDVARYVRTVYTDGSLSYDIAHIGHGVVAACVI